MVRNMGNGQSSSELTYDSLVKQTKTTRDIVSLILKQVMSKQTIADFNRMSSETECKRYVFSLAENLSKLFTQIKLYPERDGDTIAFIKVEDPSKMSTDKKAAHKNLCLVISYFYTRIIQIYGALALTLMDDMKSITHGELEISGGGEGGGSKPTQREMGVMYNLFAQYVVGNLVRIRETGQTAYKLKIDAAYESMYDIYIKMVSAQSVGSMESKATIIVIFRTGGKKYIIKLDISGRLKNLESADKIELTIENIRFGDHNISIKEKTTFIYNPTNNIYIKFMSSDTPVASLVDVINSKKGVFTKVFKRDQNYEITGTDGVGVGVGAANAGRAGVPEALYMEGLKSQLGHAKSLPHCVSRALQLLQSDPMGDKSFYSSICNLTFMDVSKRHVSGLPIGNKQLSTSPGIKALDHLFYDTIEDGKIKMSGEDTVKQYMTFMSTMSGLFGDSGKKSIGTIINKRDVGECKSTTGDNLPKTFFVNKKEATVVSPYVQKLFALQLAHAKSAGEILNELFLIQKNKEGGIDVQIHPNIFNKGMSEIERINLKARKLLTKYYINCEDTYVYGFEAARAVLRKRLTGR